MFIEKDYPIAKLSTFKIGGRAKFFCEVNSFNELKMAIKAARRVSADYKIIAGGSNIVFPDKALNALLIKVRSLSSPKIEIYGERAEVDCGVELMTLIKQSVGHGMSGLETLSGIPGTVGGAIVGNAGAYGNSISGALERVLVWDPSDSAQGKLFWLNNNQCRFQYRHSIFKESPYIVVRAVFKFKPGNPGELKTTSKNIIATRLKKYPPGLLCPGSFFKNVLVAETAPAALELIDKTKIIEGKIPAGYLLETVGAKGMQVGSIRIADFHGNLFINEGRAKSADVKELAAILKEQVQRKFGINLEEEVRYF